MLRVDKILPAYRKSGINSPRGYAAVYLREMSARGTTYIKGTIYYSIHLFL